MTTRKRPSKKKLEQAELKEINAIQITLVASEANLQRIAAILLFADHHKPVYTEKEAPLQLPWEEDAPLPELEINRTALENAVMPLLETYLNRHGRDKTQEMIKSFGAERAFQLADMQLLDMHNALAGEAASV
jgi:hypothetical protein